MSTVPIQITGVLWDHAKKKGTKVTLMGDAAISGLVIGGGPIMPPDTTPPDPGEPPYVDIGFPIGPEHPIVIPPTPPGTDPPHPAHPIVLPPIPPDPPIDTVPPPGGPPDGWSWQWLADSSQWVLVYNPPGSGKPSPPGANPDAPHVDPRRG